MISNEVSIENFSPAGKSLGVVRVAKIVKTDAEWQAQLSPLSYRVARQAGTEMAFTGEYDKESRGRHLITASAAIPRCTIPRPSSIPAPAGRVSGSRFRQLNVVKSSDITFGMSRDAISCRRCDAHLGHVFDDGPKPTGLRYCMNSVALHFAARA